MPKKSLYLGDSNATMTICYPKRRRHLSSDIAVFALPALKSQVDMNGDHLCPEAIEGMGLDKDQPLLLCKHCKQNPFNSIEPKAEPIAA